MTESWVRKQAYCPNCGSRLRRFDNNKPVADFYCSFCSEEYELKSKQGALTRTVVDGAYSAMMKRLRAPNNPNLLLLAYDASAYTVSTLLTIPRHLFVPSIIERRRALRPTARRAGWVGCNIVIENIPALGKVFLVRDGLTIPKREVLRNWSTTDLVRTAGGLEAQGWLLDVLTCVDRLKKTEFSLDEIYRFERSLKAKHPANNNVRAKIRQQLQILRDRGILDFVRPGKYRLQERPE
jgi:type II restriction enzyme